MYSKTFVFKSKKRHGSASFPVIIQSIAETRKRTPLLWIGGIESTTTKYLQKLCFFQSTERHGSASFPVTMQLRSTYKQTMCYY